MLSFPAAAGAEPFEVPAGSNEVFVPPQIPGVRKFHRPDAVRRLIKPALLFTRFRRIRPKLPPRIEVNSWRRERRRP